MLALWAGALSLALLVPAAALGGAELLIALRAGRHILEVLARVGLAQGRALAAGPAGR